VLATFPLTCAAQLNPAAVRRINNNLANDAVGAVEVFSAANTIGTGNFTYDNPGPDDVEFQTYKLPWSRWLRGATNRFRPFIEGYLGYFQMKQELASAGPPPSAIRIRSLTASFGGGVRWALNDWLSATPRMMLAYSHAWQHLNRDAPAGDPWVALFTNWEADALTLLPSMEVNGTWTVGRWDLGAGSRYTYIRATGLHDNSPLIEVNSDSHVWRNEVSASYRSPWKVFGSRLRPFGLFARHDLAGQILHSGFVDSFYETRLGIGVSMPDRLKPVRELSLNGACYFEGPFNGYSIGLSLGF
jgi:hypothetical protein